MEKQVPAQARVHSACHPRDGREFHGRSLRVSNHLARQGAHVCTLTGDIDLAGVPLMRRALAGGEQSDAWHLVIDLSRVSFLAVSGAEVLAAAAARALAQGWRLSLVVAGRPVTRALEITGLHEHVPTYPSLADALAGATPGSPTVEVRR